MNINELITQIPENTYDEALLAVQTVIVDPARESARLTCHLTHKFRIEVALSLGLIRISAENRPDVFTDVGGFLGQLKRQIHEIDEAIGTGRYFQTPPKPIIITDFPSPPADMDIPVWDEKTGTWYDAEY